MVNRLYVEKKTGERAYATKVAADIVNTLGIIVPELRCFIRYDVDGVTDEAMQTAATSIFSEPTVDNVYDNLDFLQGYTLFVTQFLDGQYDQRADSAAQCVQLLTHGIRPRVRCAEVFAFMGVSDTDVAAIKRFLINPVDSEEGSFEEYQTLERSRITTGEMRVPVNGFSSMDERALREYYDSFGFAMNYEDLVFVRDYFRTEHRDPTYTELKVIDTYWSDHCRHTTFLTELTDISVQSDNPNISRALAEYRATFAELYAARDDKYPCLMDMATIAAKALKRKGLMTALDESDEINACSVNARVDVDGEEQDWLIMFKNETHNHPTEIEPYGGAATCLGGAIRDPLSGRSYVYQAMRLTGAGNVLEPYSATLRGKLPQKMLTKTALAGFSSYGNQIGLATGIVHELYHENYKAKRLETGYVIGGAPKANVRRETPAAGDVVILVGGDTGRDGCGGATGSSKAHNTQSVAQCGAEVQKGNPPEERKLQRLFRNADAAALIIRCNDFGAGGVSVAIGELSEGLDIHLDRVTKKYEGLTATELAISESQERMAVVVHAEDAVAFIEYAARENLVATCVAEVTDTARLRMFYGNETIVDIARSFLDTNGVKQEQSAVIAEEYSPYLGTVAQDVATVAANEGYGSALLYYLAQPSECSQKGAGEVFDSTIGAASILMPFGGTRQLTPSTVMAAKPPVSGFTHTVTASSYAIDPYFMSVSPFLGATYSVVTAVSKLISAGVSPQRVWLTLQEFFPKPLRDAKRWGLPAAALLGAFDAQMGLHVAAIGGKDSMSGTFEDIDVPPTLIAFGMGIAQDTTIRHNAFGGSGNLYLYDVPRDEYSRPRYDELCEMYAEVHALLSSGAARNTAVTEGSIITTVARSIVGNGVGCQLDICAKQLFERCLGSILVVADELPQGARGTLIGRLDDSGVLSFEGNRLTVEELIRAYTSTMEPIYPTVAEAEGRAKNVSFSSPTLFSAATGIAKPRVFIPVFPGTNCEYDTARAFVRQGATADIFVLRNGSAEDIKESITEMCRRLRQAQIIAFPGGFSGGDEPDGSGKFIATAFRNPYLAEAVEELLYTRDGLALGICNGFQALIKLGLLPYGHVRQQTADSPTLTFNNIHRHVSTIARVRVATTASPWLCGFEVGDIFSVPVSHGEGKFIAPSHVIDGLALHGQIATQYVDTDGNATMLSPYNPNGSMNAVEGIISPDGRVFGKMGHAERFEKGLYQNVDGNFDMNIFRNAVRYYN